MRILFTGNIFQSLMAFMRTHGLVLYCHCCEDATFLVRLRGCRFEGHSLHDSTGHDDTIEGAIIDLTRKISRTTLVNIDNGREIDVGYLPC